MYSVFVNVPQYDNECDIDEQYGKDQLQYFWLELVEVLEVRIKTRNRIRADEKNFLDG